MREIAELAVDRTVHRGHNRFFPFDGRGGPDAVPIEKIGVLGFSAGGHLAATAATLFDRGPEPGVAGHTRDAIDDLSARPDFAVMVYPVILTDGPFAHAGSRKNLLGESPDAELLALLSPVQQVTANTPPMFFVHAADDRVVPPQNSFALAATLQEAGIENEVHVFRRGGHGFGLGAAPLPAAAWPALCLDWLRDLNLLKSGSPAQADR